MISSVSFLVFEPKVLMINTLLRLVVQFSLNFHFNSKLLSYFVKELVVQVHAQFFLAVENSEILILLIARVEESVYGTLSCGFRNPNLVVKYYILTSLRYNYKFIAALKSIWIVV